MNWISCRLSQRFHFYITDHLGSVRAILDSQGNIKSTHDFEPFGVELQPLSAESTNFKYKYTGQERDDSTNLDYMHFRYYASRMGRFLKPDNIIPNAANPQSWNLYSYVNGNPVNFNDPTGHFAGGFGGGITQGSMKKEYFAPPSGTAWELTMVEKLTFTITENYTVTVSTMTLGDVTTSRDYSIQYNSTTARLSFWDNISAGSYVNIYYFGNLEYFASKVRGSVLAFGNNTIQSEQVTTTQFKDASDLKNKIEKQESSLTDLDEKGLTLVLISHFSGEYFYPEKGKGKITSEEMLRILGTSKASYFVIIGCNTGTFGQRLAQITDRGVWAYPNFVSPGTFQITGYHYKPLPALIVTGN